MNHPEPDTPERPPAREQQPPQARNRTLYLLSVFCFFLPFATAKGCAGEAEQSYTGVELALGDLGMLLMAVILLAALFFAFSFRRRVLTPMRVGLVQASKAFLCALAVVTTILATGFTFLFTPFSARVGLYLCVGSWLAIYWFSIDTAVRNLRLARRECRDPPPPWGRAVVSLLVVVDATTVLVSGPAGVVELLLGLSASLLLGAPVIVFAMLMAIRRRSA